MSTASNAGTGVHTEASPIGWQNTKDGVVLSRPSLSHPYLLLTSDRRGMPSVVIQQKSRAQPHGPCPTVLVSRGPARDARLFSSQKSRASQPWPLTVLVAGSSGTRLLFSVPPSTSMSSGATAGDPTAGHAPPSLSSGEMPAIRAPPIVVLRKSRRSCMESPVV